MIEKTKHFIAAATLSALLIPGSVALASPAPASPSPEVRYVTVATHRATHGYYVKRRSHKKSAAIVGVSALAGAGIGALAGGGKGAGIGALVGGAGGLIYDRKTHKKVVRY